MSPLFRKEKPELVTQESNQEHTEEEPQRVLGLCARLLVLVALFALVLAVLSVVDFSLFQQILVNPGLYLMLLAGGAVVALWGSEDFGGFGR